MTDNMDNVVRDFLVYVDEMNIGNLFLMCVIVCSLISAIDFCFDYFREVYKNGNKSDHENDI